MPTTSFGKEIRKLRVDYDQTQKDLAKLLGGVTCLSFCRWGREEAGVSKNWTEKIARIYQLSQRQTERLQAAIDDSSAAVKIDLRSASSLKRQMAIKLAWEFLGLDDETVKQILEILEKEKQGWMRRGRDLIFLLWQHTIGNRKGQVLKHLAFWISRSCNSFLCFRNDLRKQRKHPIARYLLTPVQ